MSSLGDVGRGFRDFLLRGNVIDLAVAVVIGAAFTAIVTALVEDLLTPFIAAIVGKPSFNDLTFTINHAQFKYGAFLTAVINFVLIAAAVYFFIVLPVKKLTELRAKRRATGEDVDAPTPPTDEAVLLAEIRDLLKSQRSA
jgi:large conductance mechanosensitive channel